MIIYFEMFFLNCKNQNSYRVMFFSRVFLELFGWSHDIFSVMALHISGRRIPSNNPCTKHVVYFSFPNSDSELSTTSPNNLGEMTCIWGTHSGVIIVESFFWIYCQLKLSRSSKEHL